MYDIGANEGQYSMQLRKSGYDGKIISFEPLSSAYNKLLLNSKNDSNWKVAPQVAIGDIEGQIEIHISQNSVSSSILNMLDKHSSVAPESVYIGKETVKVNTLDNFNKEYISDNTRLFIKIDTQGFEDKVLNGATEILKKAIGLQLELSTVPLYQGQALYDKLINLVIEQGFELWSIHPAFVDLKSGRVLQIDATFLKKYII